MSSPIPECPEISDALIHYLESVFPDVAADPAAVNPHFAFGQAKLIRHLKMKQQQQSEISYVSPENPYP